MAESFKVQVDRWIAKAKARTDIAVRAVSLEALTRVTTRTPVDTGFARAQWSVSRNAPKAGSGGVDPSGAATIAAGAATIESVRAGDRVYITNNAPYINRLEWGHSQQAPNGMVRLTVRELQQMVNAAVVRAKREKP